MDYPRLPYEILPYGNFKGGASIATGNFGNGGTIVTGAGAGGGPHVKIMNSEGIVINQFFPYPAAFKGGVNVAAADVNGDGIDEIITGADPGGTPHVRIISASGVPIGSFLLTPWLLKEVFRLPLVILMVTGKQKLLLVPVLAAVLMLEYLRLMERQLVDFSIC